MAGFAKFENRTAVVTGGASGIGRELVLQLVRRGTHVAVCDVDEGKLQAAVGRLVQEVASAHGGDAIHLLFNNAVVVNTSSVSGLWASLGAKTPHTAYASAKFAVRGFTESLRVDFQAHAPHVSAVLVPPGHVRTGMPSPPRSWRRALGALFADYEPVSSEQAAAILDAVGRGDWRGVIGQDAEAVDARAAPAGRVASVPR